MPLLFFPYFATRQPVSFLQLITRCTTLNHVEMTHRLNLYKLFVYDAVQSLFLLSSTVFTSASPFPFGANAIKLVHFVTFNARCLLRARKIVLEVSGVEARSFARRTLRNAKNAEACALWVLEGTEIDKDN